MTGTPINSSSKTNLHLRHGDNFLELGHGEKKGVAGEGETTAKLLGPNGEGLTSGAEDRAVRHNASFHHAHETNKAGEEGI